MIAKVTFDISEMVVADRGKECLRCGRVVGVGGRSYGGVLPAVDQMHYTAREECFRRVESRRCGSSAPIEQRSSGVRSKERLF